MRRCCGLNYQLIALVVSTLLTACGGGGGGGGGGSVTVTTPTGDNVAPIVVNGGLNGNVNQAFVSVQVCVPGTAQCQTIDNILIDTGSVGLRLVSAGPSAPGGLSLTLPQQSASNGDALAECVEFVDNSHAWGPLQMADVKIVGETASAIPIQLVTSTSAIGAEPSTCGGGDTTKNLTTPAKLGGNGILGIGNFQEDCGPGCTTIANNGFYYRCPISGCIQSIVTLANQLQNPIAKFSQDNNGSLIQLPAVAGSGAANVSGYLIFGINTRSNNQLGAASPQYIQNNGRISTTFNGQTYTASFIDSGSNGLYFPNVNAPTITECQTLVGFYCPSSTLSKSATIFGAAPSANANITFNVANAESLNGNFDAFNNLAGRYDNGFDWGLPFFYGRKVFTSIEGTSGISAPYVAF